MSHDTVLFKRAQTFAFTYLMAQPFAHDPDPANWTVDCQMRERNGAEIIQVTMLKSGTESDPTGHLTLPPMAQLAVMLRLL